MANKNFTRFAVLFLILAASSCFAQNNGTINCYGPLRSVEDYGNPPADTDDGSGSLQMTINCTAVPNAGASGYLSAFYESNVVTLQHATDVTLVSGFVVTDGKKAGWAITLEVTLPQVNFVTPRKRFKIAYNSIPSPDGSAKQQWPIVLSLPAGTKLQAEVYVFSGDVSNCAGICYGNAQWALQ